MTWRPTGREVFDRILQAEMETLTAIARASYENYAKLSFEQPCSQDADSGVARGLVVAGYRNRLLFYDDLEEEFGVRDDHGIRTALGTFGPLVAAVLAPSKRPTD
jgi:hypothetical protein